MDGIGVLPPRRDPSYLSFIRHVAQIDEVTDGVALDICVDGLDVYQAGKEDRPTRASRMIQTCMERATLLLSVRPGILPPFSTMEGSLAPVDRPVSVIREEVKRH